MSEGECRTFLYVLFLFAGVAKQGVIVCEQLGQSK